MHLKPCFDVYITMAEEIKDLLRQFTY